MGLPVVLHVGGVSSSIRSLLGMIWEGWQWRWHNSSTCLSEWEQGKGIEKEGRGFGREGKSGLVRVEGSPILRVCWG